MKACNICGIVKPIDSEHFHRKSDSKDGFSPKCKVCASEYQKNRNSDRNTSAMVQLRLRALEVLGARCSCGFSDVRALQIDHVNGGGHSERKEKGSRITYRNIIAGNTEDYQVLCANCNCIKRIENREHKGNVTP